jgi:hypothetical protein
MSDLSNGSSAQPPLPSCKVNKVKIVGTIVFSGELHPDPSDAAEALRMAGFEVTMMPEQFLFRLAHPEDYFMEASIEGIDDEKIVGAIKNEIDAIVDPYGGLCMEWGPIPSDDYVPFEGIFEEPKYRIN